MPTEILKLSCTSRNAVYPNPDVWIGTDMLHVSRASISSSVELEKDIILDIWLILESGSKMVIAQLNAQNRIVVINMEIDSTGLGFSVSSSGNPNCDVSVNILVTAAAQQVQASTESTCPSCRSFDEVLTAFRTLRDKFVSDAIDMRQSGLYGCTTLLIGDSILRYVDPQQLNADVYVQAMGGCRIDELENVLRCQSLPKLKKLILHIGVNNTHGGDFLAAREIAKYEKLLSTCAKVAPKARIILSGICPRGDKTYCQQYVFRLNKEIESLAESRGLTFIDNSSVCLDENCEIVGANMAHDRLHVSPRGTKLLLTNIDAVAKILAVPLVVEPLPSSNRSFSSQWKPNANFPPSQKQSTVDAKANGVVALSVNTYNAFSDLSLGALFDGEPEANEEQEEAEQESKQQVEPMPVATEKQTQPTPVVATRKRKSSSMCSEGPCEAKKSPVVSPDTTEIGDVTNASDAVEAGVGQAKQAPKLRKKKKLKMK